MHRQFLLRGALLAPLLALCSTAAATGPDRDALQACGLLPVSEQLDCFRQLAGLPPLTPAPAATPPAPAPAPSSSDDGSRLDYLWSARPRQNGEQGNQGVFSAYRPSYLLLTYTHSPNNEAKSPTRAAVIREEGPYDTREGKFHLSVKSLFAGNHTHSLWFAYSQQSHWQVLDGAHSRPFRANNYEPEAIYSWRFSDRLRERYNGLFGLTPRMLNIGFAHQSNGEPKPQSRSWNRLYAQLGLEKTLSGDKSFAVLIRPWWRIPERATDDDNPDLTKYLGYGELELRYWWSRQASLSLIARKRSAQVDLAWPLGIPGWFSCDLLQWHLHYFNGYGESLIDYNRRHRSIGLGISIPFPDARADNSCRDL